MGYIDVFQRSEIKYLLSPEQYKKVRDVVLENSIDDAYAHSSIRNIYYDTPSFLLIRRSLEKPVFKEKLRVRSYVTAGENDMVFVEIKRKYNSVVYKRRIAVRQSELEDVFYKNSSDNSQITNEIQYFVKTYENLQPTVFISYERDAYVSTDGTKTRITFDKNIMWRTDRLQLSEEPDGNKLLEDGYVLMEIKTTNSLPLWIVKVLSEEKIYKTSFSKYGMVYQSMINSCKTHSFKFIENLKEENDEKFELNNVQESCLGE